MQHGYTKANAEDMGEHQRLSHPQDLELNVHGQYQFDREFAICPDPHSVPDPNQEFSQSYLPFYFTLIHKPWSSIAFHFNEEDLGTTLVGIEFDGFLIGNKVTSSQPKAIENVSFFRTLRVQHFYGEHSHQNSRTLYPGISYLYLQTDDGEITEIGIRKKVESVAEEKTDDRAIDIRRRHYPPLYREQGQLFIYGVIQGEKNNIIGIQVVDLMDTSRDSQLSVYRLTNHQSMLRIKGLGPKQKESMFRNRPVICTEDVTVDQVLTNLCELVLIKHDPSSDILPAFLDILNKCIDGDLSTIHSVASLKRFIDFAIQTEFVSTDFDNESLNKLFGPNKYERKYLLKAREYCNALYDAVMICKRIIFYTPSLNIYSLSHLQPNEMKHKWFAWGTFLAQSGLFIMLIISLLNKRNWDVLIESTPVDIVRNAIMAILITFIVILLFITQYKAFQDFRFCFLRNNKWSAVMYCSYGINVFVAFSLIFINAIVILCSESALSLVFNAIAVLFVLELDDQIVDINANDEKSIYLEYIVRNVFFVKFKQISSDRNWIDYMHPIFHRNYEYKIDTLKCEVVWPSTDFKFMITDQLVDYIPAPSAKRYSSQQLASLNDKQLTFRINNKSGVHVRFRTAGYNSRDRTTAFWEIVIGVGGKVLIRKNRGPNYNNSLFTDLRQFSFPYCPLVGTWIKFEWEADEKGFMKMYLNEKDPNPTTDSENTSTVEVFSFSYAEYVNKACEARANYDPIRIVEIGAFQRSVEPIVFL